MFVTKLKSSRGSFLFGVLIHALILSIVLLALVTLVTTQNRAQTIYTEERKAFYAAESGVEYAIGVLTDSADWRDGASHVSVGEGEFSITVEDGDSDPALGDTLRVTSNGSLGSIRKIIEVLLLQTPDVWDYALYAGEDIDFTAGKGGVNGNLHANNNAQIGGGYTINGTVTEAPPTIDPPLIDWKFYEDKAKAIGQYVVGDKNFTGGLPYKDIWYITNNAIIQDNNVEIKGTIVTEGDCRIEKNNETIIAVPSDYPALVVGGSLIFGGNGALVKGLIYCENDLTINKNNFTIVGAVICNGTLTNLKNKLSITYDPTFTTNVAGMTFDPGVSAEPPQIARWGILN